MLKVLTYLTCLKLKRAQSYEIHFRRPQKRTIRRDDPQISPSGVYPLHAADFIAQNDTLHVCWSIQLLAFVIMFGGGANEIC